MKLLLTSGGVRNPSIKQALVGLLDKPIAECTALVHPDRPVGPPDVHARPRFGGSSSTPAPAACATWAGSRVGLLELTALPSIAQDRWVPWVQAADVLLVDGGDATYLCHWLRESGLADLLPSCRTRSGSG